MYFYISGAIWDVDALLEFAQLGVYCQFDSFGSEESAQGWLSDAQRIDFILRLFKEGHNKVMVSSDVAHKNRLVRFSFYVGALKVEISDRICV